MRKFKHKQTGIEGTLHDGELTYLVGCNVRRLDECFLLNSNDWEEIIPRVYTEEEIVRSVTNWAASFSINIGNINRFLDKTE